MTTFNTDDIGPVLAGKLGTHQSPSRLHAPACPKQDNAPLGNYREVCYAAARCPKQYGYSLRQLLQLTQMLGTKGIRVPKAKMSEATPAVANVCLDRVLAWRVAVFALLFSWPLILFGSPAYIQDSVSYLKGGKAAVEYVESKIIQNNDSASEAIKSLPTATSNVVIAKQYQSEPKAARSIFYSVAAYLLRWPGISMAALAFAQIVATSFICAVVVGAAGVKRRTDFFIIAIVLATATPLAAFAAFAVPDIFAGLIVAGSILVVTRLDRLSMGVRLGVAGISGFAFTSHVSIPPLAAGMIIVGGAVLLMRARFALQYVPRAWAWLVVPLLMGGFATAAASWVAFGEANIAAKRFPLALARSVSDGPGRWYLERHCATDRYAVCEVFGTRVPTTVYGFLFEKSGLDGRATAEQMDRIRAEEPEIVIRAALEYPGVEAYNLSRNIVLQIFRFDLGITNFSERVTLDATGTPGLVPTGRDHSAILNIVEWLTNFALALSAGWAIWNFRRLDNSERTTLLLLVAAIVGNAVICVMFSGIAGRYQARMIWLLPLFVLSMIVTRYRRIGKLPIRHAGSADI